MPAEGPRTGGRTGQFSRGVGAIELTIDGNAELGSQGIHRDGLGGSGGAAVAQVRNQQLVGSARPDGHVLLVFACGNEAVGGRPLPGEGPRTQRRAEQLDRRRLAIGALKPGDVRHRSGGVLIHRDEGFGGAAVGKVGDHHLVAAAGIYQHHRVHSLDDVAISAAPLPVEIAGGLGKNLQLRRVGFTIQGGGRKGGQLRSEGVCGYGDVLRSETSI